jgi:hypothetical protein
MAKEAVQQWELVSPSGIVSIKPMKQAPHPTTLEGKTVALRWNGKQNGNHFLDRLAEMLSEKVKNVKVVKIYEREPWTNLTAGPPYMSAEDAKKIAHKIAEYKPDLVIASQAD